MININNQFILSANIEDVLTVLRLTLNNGKLKDIQDKTDDIVVSFPFHSDGQEEHGSCFIRKKDGVFHCFGCGEKGPFLKFIAGCFNSSEDFAEDWLFKNFGGELITKATFMDDDIKINLNGFRKSTHKIDPAILDQFQTWTPYLAKRKLSREICELFKVRYDPKYRQVIFPAYDIKGNLVMLPKRSIDTKTFYLDKNVEKPVYCLDYIIKNNITTAIITEGPFDCLTGWEYGFPTIATFGKISDYQIEQINKSCIRILYAMFDNDAAGKAFTETLKKKLTKRIIIIETKFPAGRKDINDLSKEELQQIIKNAQNS